MVFCLTLPTLLLVYALFFFLNVSSYINLFYLINLSVLDFIQFSLNTPQINGLTFLFFWLALAYLLQSPSFTVTMLLCFVFIKLPLAVDIATSVTYLLPDYNVLLINPINKIHPGCLYVSVAFTTLTFFKITLVRMSNTQTHRLISITTYFFLLEISALLSGCWWAFQESSWGGWWVWELSECLLGLIILLYVYTYHTRFTVSTSSLYFNLYSIQWLFLYTYWLLVKSFFSTTLHSFFNSSVGTLTAFQLSSTAAPILVTLLFISLSNTPGGSLSSTPPRSAVISLLYIQITLLYFIISEYSVPSYQYLVCLAVWWVIVTTPSVTTWRAKKEHSIYFAALVYFSTLPLMEFSSSYTQVPTESIQSVGSFFTCIDELFVQILVVGTSMGTPHTYFTNASSFIFALHQATSTFYLSIPGAFCFFIILRCDFLIMYVWYLVLNFGFLQLL